MRPVMLNGELVPAADAVIPALDRALTHGLGLYETLKLVDGVPVFFEEHLDRLDAGLATVGIAAPFARTEVAEQVVRLSRESGVSDGACRPLVTAGPPWGSPSLLIIAEVRDFPSGPLRLISYHSTRSAAGLKSILFMASHVAQRSAVSGGADDAIFVDEGGLMYEATTANLFVCHEGALRTTPTDGSILPGVIRGKVLALARGDGLVVDERYTRRDELDGTYTLLLTSSVRGVVQASSIDGQVLHQDDALVGRLRRLVGAAERASAAAFRDAYL